mgnify:CR=1 FL=1
MELLITVLITNDYVCSVSTISQPDYESAWLELSAQSQSRNTFTVQHGLGETPLLVDVQIKSLDHPNKDFIFPAVGKHMLTVL